MSWQTFMQTLFFSYRAQFSMQKMFLVIMSANHMQKQSKKVINMSSVLLFFKAMMTICFLLLNENLPLCLTLFSIKYCIFWSVTLGQGCSILLMGHFPADFIQWKKPEPAYHGLQETGRCVGAKLRMEDLGEWWSLLH